MAHVNSSKIGRTFKNTVIASIAKPSCKARELARIGPPFRERHSIGERLAGLGGSLLPARGPPHDGGRSRYWVSEPQRSAQGRRSHPIHPSGSAEGRCGTRKDGTRPQAQFKLIARAAGSLFGRGSGLGDAQKLLSQASAAACHALPRAGHPSGAFGDYSADVGPGCTGQSPDQVR
jgi:hypothetical protein